MSYYISFMRKVYGCEKNILSIQDKQVKINASITMRNIMILLLCIYINQTIGNKTIKHKGA